MALDKKVLQSEAVGVVRTLASEVDLKGTGMKEYSFSVSDSLTALDRERILVALRAWNLDVSIEEAGERSFSSNRYCFKGPIPEWVYDEDVQAPQGYRNNDIPSQSQQGQGMIPVNASDLRWFMEHVKGSPEDMAYLAHLQVVYFPQKGNQS